jgi:hypothetical protein
MKPGLERNEPRRTAKVLRELSKLEANSQSVLDFDWPQRT